MLIDMAVEDTAQHDAVVLDAARRHVRSCTHCQSDLNAYRGVVGLFTASPVSEEEVAGIAENVRRRVLARVSAYNIRRRVLRWSFAVSVLGAIAVLAIVGWRVVAARGAKPVATKAAPTAQSTPKVAERLPPITLAQRAKLDEAARLRELNSVYVWARRYDKATPPLRRAIQLAQGILVEGRETEAELAALYELYRCHQLLGEYSEREHCLHGYLGKVRRWHGSKAAAQALVEDARRLIAERDLDTAGRHLERAMALQPTGQVAIEAHLLMAQAAEHEKLYDLAHSQYQMVLELGPRHGQAADIRWKMVTLNARRQRFKEAAADAEALCAMPEPEVPPQNRIVHHCVLARLYEGQGRVADAVRTLRSVIAKYKPEETCLARDQLDRLVHGTVDRLIEKEILQ